MKKLKMVFLFSLIFAVLILSACSPAKIDSGAQNAVPTQSDTGKEVTLEMFNFGFKQSAPINVGDNVILRVKSTQGFHSVAIPDLGIASKALSAGEEQVLRFTATKAGNYEMICSTYCGSGHAGMRDYLIIS